MRDIALTVKRRETGKKAAKAVRNSGMIPGVFYARGKEAISIAISPADIRPVVYTAEAHVVHLTIEGEAAPFDCILRDVEFDPITDKIVHFDLFGLSEDSPVQVSVPVVLTGIAEGVKAGGTLQQLKNKLNIKVLPARIPKNLEVDVTGIGIGRVLRVRELNYEGITLVTPASEVVAGVVAKRGAKTEGK